MRSADFSKTHTLIMLSGGLDSLYVLHEALTRSDDVLWVHHVNLVNREQRHRAEALACARIVAWCTANLRPFRYTESTIDHSAFELFGRDLLMVAFEAGVVAQNAHALWKRGFDRWMLGYCQEEADELVNGVPAASTARRGLTETCIATSAAPLIAPPLHSRPLLPKRAQLDALPAELAALAWTCRRPIWREDTPAECGSCKTCKLMRGIRAGQPTTSTSTSDATPRALTCD